jgi:hypothetical protein
MTRYDPSKEVLRLLSALPLMSNLARINQLLPKVSLIAHGT